MFLDENPTICVFSLLITLPFDMCIFLVEHSSVCVFSLLSTLPFVYAPCWTLFNLCILLVEHPTICVCSLMNTLPLVYAPCWKLHYFCMLYIHHSTIWMIQEYVFCSELGKLSRNRPDSIRHISSKKSVNIWNTVIPCNWIVIHIYSVQIIMYGMQSSK